MGKSLLIIILFSMTVISLNAGKNAFQIFEKDGDDSDFEELTEKALEADVILFGELHNNPINHWLQLGLAKELHKEVGNNLVIGMEMFEADDQLKIDEYFNGKISTSSFEKEARTWNNYKTDYKPVLEFARENELLFVATNIPRRYASAIARSSFTFLDSLPKESRRYFPPTPIEADLELPGYKKMLESMGGSSHGMPHIVEAQAIKDATMAFFILENFEKGKIFLHLNGAYHSNNYEGIYWFLKQRNPELKIITISSAEQEDIEELEDDNKDTSDFIIVTPKDMIKTY